jgi:hypothetical protein
MLLKYSLFELLKEYNKNKEYIHAKLKGETIEGYTDSGDTTMVLGLSLVPFLVILLVSFAIWIWALVVTIKYWKQLPEWAQVISVLGLLPIIPGGPIVTLVVVYVTKGGEGGSRMCGRKH